MKRPQNKTLVSVVEYLESIGLSVYGPNVDLKSGCLYHSLMDYNPQEVAQYRKLYEGDDIVDVVQECS